MALGVPILKHFRVSWFVNNDFQDSVPHILKKALRNKLKKK